MRQLSNLSLVVVLLAISSLLTMVLISIAVYEKSHVDSDDQTLPVLRATASGNTMLVHGLDLPAFSLIERNGEKVTNAQFSGKVWVANFIFTRCAGFCPVLSHHMRHLYESLSDNPHADRIRFVSISVDPEFDTPLRLQQYAAKYNADPERWVFLTGQRSAVWLLCRDGFKQTVEEDPGNDKMPIFHTSNFVLVDADGKIRGFYDSLDSKRRGELKVDLERLVDELNTLPVAADR